MRYKTLCRLLLKLIGVWLFADGLLSVMGALPQTWYFFSDTSRFMPWYLAAPIKGVLSIALGAYLLFSGKWIVDLVVPGNRAYCHECGYDLTKAIGENCPECGTARGPGS